MKENKYFNIFFLKQKLKILKDSLSKSSVEEWVSCGLYQGICSNLSNGNECTEYEIIFTEKVLFNINIDHNTNF